MNDRILPRPVAASPRPGQLVRAARRGLVPLAVALGLSAPLADIRAAEWTIAPDVSVGAHYNDNARLQIGDELIEIWGGFVDLGALAQWRSPTSTFQVRPRLRSTFYPDNEDEESNDAYLDFSARNTGLRTAWALVGNFAREQVIQGGRPRLDFEDPEFETPDDEESAGLIDARRRRTRMQIAPSFSHELTERVDAGAGLSYADVSYSPQLPGEALDYTNAGANAFIVYRLSPISRFRSTIFASAFEVDEIDNDSTAYGVRGRYEVDITEVYRVHVEAGAQRTNVESEFNGVVLDDTSTGFLFDAGVRRQWERTILQLAGGRSIQPSGRGFLTETDRVRINLRHQFRPRWFGEVAAIAQMSEGVGSASDVIGARDYYQARVRLGHELTRDWTIEGAYSFTYRDYTDGGGNAQAAEVFLSVNYQPRGRVWSR
jgi:hypothetical protein